VPLDVELGVEREHRVEQRERALDGERPRRASGLAAGRLVEGVAEEKQAVFPHVHDRTVGRVVPADVADLDGDAAEFELEAVVEHGVRSCDPDGPRSGKLRLDVRRVLRALRACRDPRVERFVAPVRCGVLGQAVVRQPVREHGRADLGGAEDVIPVGVREHDRRRRRDALGGERVEEQAGVRVRGARVEHQRGVLADHGAQRRPVGLCRRQPVDVLGDPLQAAHPDTVMV
jgi:hypothetical protein